ncbi:PaaI family thioesterase [Limnohabitans sp.]|uniref:PaaI family thioesterase n=1 Tax=Limnohabitans sp. TaxID=1907725 RepID=UPI002AFE1954|nr:PaaI family thioesterase [Limnohabitans sp.]
MSIPFGANIPFVHHLGFTLEKFEGGESELFFAPRAEHHNSFDVTHGGAVMTLLDVVMATAARSVEQNMGVVTIEMKTSFMRPAKVPPGEKLVGRGLLQHRTRSMAFTEGRIYDNEGQLCAMATGTFKYVARREEKSPSTD